MRDHDGIVIGHELRDPTDAMADVVLHQGTGQGPHPMLFIAQEGFCILLIAEIVAIIALHMDWNSTQIATLNERTHASGCMPEIGTQNEHDSHHSESG